MKPHRLLRQITSLPVSRDASSSIPVATSGASGITQGIACFCMLVPMSARFASLCSRNGIIEVAIEKAWFGSNVDIVDFVLGNDPGSAFDSHFYFFFGYFSFLVIRNTGMGNVVFFFFERVQINYLSVILPFLTLAYGVSIIPKSLIRA